MGEEVGNITFGGLSSKLYTKVCWIKRKVGL